MEIDKIYHKLFGTAPASSLSLHDRCLSLRTKLNPNCVLASKGAIDTVYFSGCAVGVGVDHLHQQLQFQQQQQHKCAVVGQQVVKGTYRRAAGQGDLFAGLTCAFAAWYKVSTLRPQKNQLSTTTSSAAVLPLATTTTTPTANKLPTTLTTVAAAASAIAASAIVRRAAELCFEKPELRRGFVAADMVQMVPLAMQSVPIIKDVWLKMESSNL